MSRKSMAVERQIAATGRRVAALRPGSNDVSRLAPGVYFVREPSGVRKVILQK